MESNREFLNRLKDTEKVNLKIEELTRIKEIFESMELVAVSPFIRASLTSVLNEKGNKVDFRVISYFYDDYGPQDG